MVLTSLHTHIHSAEFTHIYIVVCLSLWGRIRHGWLGLLVGAKVCPVKVSVGTDLSKNSVNTPYKYYGKTDRLFYSGTCMKQWVLHSECKIWTEAMVLTASYTRKTLIKLDGGG